MYSPVTGPDGSAGSVGIGFAIPSNQAQQVIDKL
jgi:putative serine protease PepD